MPQLNWEYIKNINIPQRTVMMKNRLTGKMESVAIGHDYAKNGGNGRGNAARQQRQARRMKNVRARSSKRA